MHKKFEEGQSAEKLWPGAMLMLRQGQLVQPQGIDLAGQFDYRI